MTTKHKKSHWMTSQQILNPLCPYAKASQYFYHDWQPSVENLSSRSHYVHCNRIYSDTEWWICVFAMMSCRKPSILARVAELRLEKFGDKMAEIDTTQVCRLGQFCTYLWMWAFRQHSNTVKEGPSIQVRHFSRLCSGHAHVLVTHGSWGITGYNLWYIR